MLFCMVIRNELVCFEAPVNFIEVDSSILCPLLSRDNINFNIGGSEP